MTPCLLLTLNRGEGGQNKVGSNLFDVLGVLRTLELTASDRYYGVEQRFTRVADFGFSKKPGRDFSKVAWARSCAGGHRARDSNVPSRRAGIAFPGHRSDGHGNHQASGTVSREAFRAAADPKRFPEQINEGLLPWQAKKFYFDRVCPFRSNDCAPENYTVKLAHRRERFVAGDDVPAIRDGRIAPSAVTRRRRMVGGRGPHYAFYRLVDSVLPSTKNKDGHEQDFFDGIDTTLPGLANRLAPTKPKVPYLRPELVKIAGEVEAAKKLAADQPSKAALPLLQGLRDMNALISHLVPEKQIAPIEQRELLGNLRL